MLGLREGDGRGEIKQEYPLGVFLRVVFKYFRVRWVAGRGYSRLACDLYFFIECANRDSIDIPKLSPLAF